jgi:hypothetical protein
VCGLLFAELTGPATDSPDGCELISNSRPDMPDMTTEAIIIIGSGPAAWTAAI